MSLLDLKFLSPLRRRPRTPGGDAVPLLQTTKAAADAVRLDPEGEPLWLIAHVTGRGWELLADRGAGSGFPATPLAPHGAGVDAPTRVAQAVAVRILASRGVTVTGWTDWPTRSPARAAVGGGDATTLFRASLVHRAEQSATLDEIGRPARHAGRSWPGGGGAMTRRHGAAHRRTADVPGGRR